MSFTDEFMDEALSYLPQGPSQALIPEPDAPAPAKDDEEPVYTDEELLAIVADERRRSVGFDLDNDELASSRTKALEYYKGEMDDVPALPNRSKAVSTDVAEAVETLLPDLVEIFTGGEDVATFRPVGKEDEDGAAQETDYLNHVVFNENPGFLILYTMFKDGLLQKTGVVKFWWDAVPPEVAEEHYSGQNAAQLQIAIQAAQEQGAGVRDIAQTVGDDGQPAFSFCVYRAKPRAKARITAVPPDDFTVSSDTVTLADAPYCAMRSRPRVQDLIAEGYDAELVESLPTGTSYDQTVAQARDTAGEHDHSPDMGGKGGLRFVEVVEHYIRLANAEGEIELWQIVTGAGEKVLLHKEKFDAVPYAAITPYLTPHRFYGRSVADLLMEIQRIKTALTRMALDSGYFALNQRHEVALDQANQFTIGDLLRNEPGVPVRSKTGSAVRAISAGNLNFDAFGALEYFSTVAEHRTGIARNAQGLNPDTLHDTAKGAAALMGAAQKRVRLIARIFAETGIKDMYLGLHAVIRKNANAAAKVRLRGKWVEVDPTSWGARSDMAIHVGLGSGGRDHDLMMLQMQIGAVEKLVAGGKANLVTDRNLYNLTKRLFEKTGTRDPESFITEPKESTGEPAAPPPDPKVIEAQGKAQAQVIEAQSKAAQELAETQAKLSRAAAAQAFDQQQADQQAQRDHERAMAKIAADTHLGEIRIAEEVRLKQRQQDAEFALGRDQLDMEAALEEQAQVMGQDADGGANLGDGVQFGGEIG